MVLKNIKEIKNIEKKIIHRKISSSRYVRMIRFFDVFFFIFTSHNFKVMHNQLSKIFSQQMSLLRRKPIFIDYMWRCFDREICGKSSYSRENI